MLLLTLSLSDGVYRSGFATTQESYSKAVKEVFEALDKLETILDGKDYLVGNRLTEADIRLWVTIVSMVLSCRPEFSMMERLAVIDTLRPGLCWTLQVQHPNHSRGLS